MWQEFCPEGGGGVACVVGGMGMHGGRVCMAGGGGMCGRGHVWQGGMCGRGYA